MDHGKEKEGSTRLGFGQVLATAEGQQVHVQALGEGKARESAMAS